MEKKGCDGEEDEVQGDSKKEDSVLRLIKDEVGQIDAVGHLNRGSESPAKRVCCRPKRHFDVDVLDAALWSSC